MEASDGETRLLIEKLLEYSGPNSKWRPRERDRGGGGAPVGLSLILDQDFDAWVGGGTDAAGAGGARQGEYALKVLHME
jgi:hypothetical protein